jgi:peroxiredoxin
MALFLVVVNSPNAVLAQYAPRVGKPHPDFVLPNIENGKPIRLSQYRGKKVLLVHFASW